MIYRELGTTGLRISRLGFGAMRPPVLEKGDWDSDLFIRCMQRAFDLGVNYVDTAHTYGGGRSEEHVGRAVRGRRDELIVSTKVSLGWGEPKTPDEWQSMLEASLSRLGTHLDILFLHDQQPQIFDGPHFDEIARRAERAVERGDARFLAVSTHASVEDSKRYLDTGIFAVVLVQYNMLNLAYDEILAYARGKGIGRVVMGPVSGGVLAQPSDILKGMSPVPVKSTAELALRFALSNADVDVALSGMSSIEMVEENVAVASLDPTLTEAERGELLRAIDERLAYRDKVCTGCGYCSDCPEGIDIKGVFGALMHKKVWGLESRARAAYGRLIEKGKSARASACAECGECEPKCPQDIPIREQMKEAAELFDKGVA